MVRNKRRQRIVKGSVSATQGASLFALRFGKRGSFGFVAFAYPDCKNVMCRVSAILHCLRITQIFQNALAERNAVFIGNKPIQRAVNFPYFYC